MAHESRTAGALSSNGLAEHPCKFGTVVRALWPTKPALILAQRLGITERGAQYLIDGDRKVTARAAAVILAEIIE